MKRTIHINWPILPGSISTAESRCGKDACACKLRSPRLHGTYYRWTGFINGKRTTKTISKDVAEECAQRIQNLRNVQRELDRLIQEALRTAPWTTQSKH
jgi:hypothetical protein